MRFRKFTLTLLLACVALLSVAQIEQVTENQAGISRRLQHEIDATKDPSLGYVPKSRLVKAYQARQARLNQLGQLNRAPLFSWTERGPTSDVTGPSNGNTRPGNGKTSGRVRAIFEDLGDATGKTVWVGGIDGGLWKTADITANPATWTPINDFFGNLAVASICQDPTDVNIMYFGTGEKSVNADAVRGAGIWRSTDHGVTWDLMPGSAALWNVSKVVCDAAGNLYVGCNSISNTQGLQRYTKATGTWTNITPTGLATRIPDIELSTTGRLHIVCGYYNSTAATSGYRYTDNPATVTAGSWTSPATSFSPVQYNVELATSGNTVYALPSNSSFQVTTIYKSTDGGANWVVTGTTPSFTSGQAWYCLAVAVDPNNADNVIVGSLDCYKTTNGGGTWTKISEWVGTTGQYVHADQQIITWSSNNQVLFGCDGGVHYSANGGTTISDRNAGLRIKQFYAVAHHPTSTNYFLAGAQDNGVHQLNNTGIGASVEVTGGDGAFVHIDQNEPQYQWGSYVYNQYRRSTNGGSTWTSVNYSSTAGKFINPTDYDDAANIMYCSGAANAFVRWSNPQTGSTFTSVTMSGLNGGKVSAVKVSPYSSNTVFFGGGGSGISPSLIKSTNADATPVFTSIIGAGMTTASSNISSIELGSDEQNIIVAYSNYGVNNVFVTTNGGASWSAVDGNLPDMPVRWAMFYPGSNTKAIIATETGIWQTEVINGAATVWDPEAGFPNVRVDMMQYRESDGLLSAATHGRGLFTTIIGAAPSCGTVAGLASSSVTTNSATVSWTSLSGAISYDVDYKLASSGTWTNAATATTNASAALGGLSSGSLYEYRVRANCAGATGAYVQAQFTTSSPATCGTVTGLASSAVTANSATVSWTALSGALNYDLDYKLASSGTWINAVTATTSLSRALTGLATGSTYDYRVRANCSGATGAYAQAQFTTTAAPTCPGIYDVSSNGSASGAATIPFNTDVKGLISSATDNDYYKFVVTTGGTATITLTTLSADFDIAVYSSDGTTRLARSQNNGTTSETITRTYAAGTYYVRVYGYNGASNATNCYTLKVQLGTATLQELPEMASENLTVKLFPNPAKDKVSVYLLGDNTRKNLIVYDVTGRAIYSQGLNEMFTTLDLQKLLKGVYVVKITALNGKVLYAEKIVKE
ncbi:MAG TPA: fibronectin type III domain-containing protein [Flavisolibacter sp.]|nr:fibronectin type III domain-containing protein [Flavisolibacter sp.]